MLKERIILGIDPGTNILGFGIIKICRKTAGFVSMGVLDLRKESDHFVKLRKITSQVMLKLGRAQGAAIAAALSRDIPIFEYAPRKIKMAITGNGAASKEQLSLMLERTLKIRFETEFLDATDALGIAMCHYYQLVNPLSDTDNSTTWEKFIKNNPQRIARR